MILNYILNLPLEEKIDGLSTLESMENNEFNKLLIKPWEKKILEVYFRKHNRIFYVINDNENIFLLHTCRKQKNKTEKKDVKIIRKRAKELGKMLNKKFI